MPAFVVQAIVNLEIGDSLSFAPTSEALCSESREWREFCRSRASQTCTITGFERETTQETVKFNVGDAIESLRILLNSPRITVRFEDGVEREISIRNFLVPQDQTAFKKDGRLYHDRIVK